MINNNSSPFMEKVSGAVSGALADTLHQQSPSLAAAQKYRERFMSNNRINSLSRICIAEDVFKVVERLVSAVGKDKVSMGSYVTEIIREHLERNKESVNTIYLTSTQPLF